MEQAISREELLSKAMAIETKLHHAHRANGYQLGQNDIADLDILIQRAITDGSPDALRQFVAIRTAFEVHGKVSYEQMKLLKEVSSVLKDEDAFKSHRL